MFFYNPLISSIQAAQASLIGIYSFTLTMYNTAGNLLYNGAAYVYNNSKFFSNYVITGFHELESQSLFLKVAHQTYDVIYGVIDDMLIPSIISTIEYLNTHPIQTTAMIAILVAVTAVIQENTLGLFCGSSSEELSQIDTNNTNNTNIITTNECVNSYSEIFTQ